MSEGLSLEILGCPSQSLSPRGCDKAPGVAGLAVVGGAGCYSKGWVTSLWPGSDQGSSFPLFPAGKHSSSPDSSEIKQ